jgi:hypothetical protein
MGMNGGIAFGAMTLGALYIGAPETVWAAATATVSWTAEGSVVELTEPTRPSIYMIIGDVTNVTACDFSFEWASVPGAHGRVGVGWWGESERPDNTWLYAKRATVRNPNAARDQCVLAGWETAASSPFKVVIPVLIEGLRREEGLWLCLTSLIIASDDGVERVGISGGVLAINASTTSGPPFVQRVDPPALALHTDGAHVTLHLEGVGLDRVADVSIVSTDEATRVVPGIVQNIDGRSSRSRFVANRRDFGGWSLRVRDAYGRETGTTKSLMFWGGNREPRGMDGERIPGASDLVLDSAIPGEIIAGLARDAVEVSTGRATITSRSLRELFDSIGVIEAVPAYRDVDRYSLWTTQNDGRRSRRPDLRHVLRLRVANPRGLGTAIQSLRAHGSIVWAEAHHRSSLAASPDDPEFCTKQWNFCSALGSWDINIQPAWNRVTGTSSIGVAVLDSGIDFNHDEFDGGFGLGYVVDNGLNYVSPASLPMDDHPESHGTMVAGLIAAITDNTDDIAGSAGGWWPSRGAVLYALKVADASGYADRYDVGDALIDCGFLFDAKIANVSLQNQIYDTYERAATNVAYADGVFCVFAKGNYGTNALVYPADYGVPGTIAVGATDAAGQRWPGTSWGNSLSVMAPGVAVWSTARNNSLRSATGTSLAAPQVAGAAALVAQRGATFPPVNSSGLAPEDVKFIVEVGADDIDPSGFDALSGYGIVNADTSVQCLEYPWEMWHDVLPGYDTITLTYTGPMRFYGGAAGAPLSDGLYNVRRYEVVGTAYYPQTFMQGNAVFAWGRGHPNGVGWSPIDPNFQLAYCEIVPWTAGNSSVQLRTWFYEVQQGPTWTWYPTHPAGVRMEYSVVGIPDPHATSVASEETAAGGLRIVPNPVTDMARFHLANSWSDEPVSLHVYDTRGRRVFTHQYDAAHLRADGVSWTPRDESGEG